MSFNQEGKVEYVHLARMKGKALLMYQDRKTKQDHSVRIRRGNKAF